MDFLVDKEHLGWLHPKSFSQQLDVQVEASKAYSPSEYSTGIGTIHYSLHLQSWVASR